MMKTITMLCLMLAALLTVSLEAVTKFPSWEIEHAVSKAIRSGDLGGLKALLAKHKLAVDTTFSVIGYGLLHEAVLAGEIKIVEYLIAQDADVNLADKYGSTPRDDVEFFDIKIIELLEKNGATPGITIRQLFDAAERGETKTVRILLDHDLSSVDIRTINIKGETVLMIAEKHGHTEIVELLHEQSTNIDATNRETELMLAAWQGRTERVTSLLDAGVNIDAANKRGFTALMLAAWQGQTKTVELLLERGANIDANNIDEETALMLATENGHTKTVELLLEWGADTEATNYAGKTVRTLATEHEHAEIVELLALSDK